MQATVISISNPLGGTGKTTIAFHLSHGLAMLGYKVLAVDIDPKASLTRAMGRREDLITYSVKDILTRSTTWWKSTLFISRNLYLIPATDELAGMDYHMLSKPFSYMKLKKKLLPAKSEHDFIILDTGPAYNLFSVNAWNFSDAVLMPFIPGPATGADIVMMLRDFQDFDVDVQVIFNQVARTRALAEQARRYVEKRHRKVEFSGTLIPRSSLIGESMVHHEPVFQRHPGSRPALALKELTALTATARTSRDAG
ncbi:MAG: ParA family protein [Acidobacteria bacterium]|nr:ParA family protein [Acidobacteriota bacterium]